ncbi:MAG TPA: hypothetical protein VNO79_03760 [Actinomycetota bacterium]|nr:hypothetical protein [Actinomycetota bacterium]
MPTSSWDAVVARIVAQMRTIAGIGVVSDQARLLDHADRLEELLSLIGGERRLRAWFVSLARMRTGPASAGPDMDWTREVRIEGFVQFEDGQGSEKLAISLAESVIRTLHDDLRATKLGGTVLSGGPGSIVDTTPRLFGGLVCSYVQIVFPVHTVETA